MMMLMTTMMMLKMCAKLNLTFGLKMMKNMVADKAMTLVEMATTSAGTRKGTSILI